MKIGLAQRVTKRAMEGLLFGALAAATVGSAIAAKEAQQAPALAAIESSAMAGPDARSAMDAQLVASVAAMAERAPAVEDNVEGADEERVAGEIREGEIRWFGGRAVRPARTIMMKVTAYSPDHRSCGKWADGVTASNKSIWTNGMKLAAADTRLLPFGSMISVPGYDDGRVVPVLDRGGAIKGNRLDLLFPTHEIARMWGVREIPVTVWEYVDESAG